MEKKGPEFEYTIVWDEKCRLIWQRDTEVGPGRGARQVICDGGKRVGMPREAPRTREKDLFPFFLNIKTTKYTEMLQPIKKKQNQ